MTEEIKSYLQIENKYLGTLLYLVDKNGRGYLKLSFKNKIADFIKYTDVPTSLPAPVKINDPISLDISYKFPDSLLEVKKLVNKKFEQEFYKVPLPFTQCLFLVRIKNWHLLDDAKPSRDALVLVPPSQSDSIIVIFSFLGSNGQPFKPQEYDCPMGMGIIDLPEKKLNRFCIGIAEDFNSIEVNGFVIQVPIQAN